jgi:hypothetical protein
MQIKQTVKSKSKPGDPNQYEVRDVKQDILDGIFKPTAVPEGLEHLETDKEDDKESKLLNFDIQNHLSTANTRVAVVSDRPLDEI